MEDQAEKEERKGQQKQLEEKKIRAGLSVLLKPSLQLSSPGIQSMSEGEMRNQSLKLGGQAMDEFILVSLTPFP